MEVTIIKNISRKLKDFDEYEKVFTIPDSVGNNEKKILKYLEDNRLLEDEDNWKDGISGQDIISDEDEVGYSLGEVVKSKKNNLTKNKVTKKGKTPTMETMNVIITKVVTRKDKSQDHFIKEFTVPANFGENEKKIVKYLKDNNLLADDSGWDNFTGGEDKIYPGDKVEYLLEEIRDPYDDDSEEEKDESDDCSGCNNCSCGKKTTLEWR